MRSGGALLVGAADIQDPGNLGAIIPRGRSRRRHGVLATRGGAVPFGWKAIRGSMGSAFRLPDRPRILRGGDDREAHTAGLQVVAAVGHGHTPMHEVDLTGPTLVVMGNEGQGLSPALADAADVRASIPMTPPVESLNVAVAAALLVYEARPHRTPQPR